MKEIGLYDARNSLSALIEEVEKTRTEILITRHGKPVARIGPANALQTLTPEERKRRFEEIFAARDAIVEAPGPWDWKAAVEEGRE